MHDKMMELFREYIVVGGMPRVVLEFVNTHNFAKVFKLQKGILSDYTDDIAEYAEGAEKNKSTRMLFCYNLSEPALPLEENGRSDIFKVYMRDTGLLVAMLDEGSAEDIIDGNLGIYKGAIYENFIADIFAKKVRSSITMRRIQNWK